MRSNFPVTQNEFPFPSGQSLVSTTDLQGRILHCNSAFIAVSGYARDELLGQPHNLIRHPDMPAEAFRDMWATIAAGKPWSGVVKNRRKNGDHYWVLAHVTPLLDGGQPVAYLSVRSEPARPQIEAAERLYASMREEQRAGGPRLRLQEGRVLRKTWHSALSRRLARLPWRGSLGFAGVGALGLGLGSGFGATAWTLLAAAAAALATAGWTQARRGRVLQQVERYANQLAAGDLSSDIQPSGQAQARSLERALRQLAVNMRALVSDTRGEVERIVAVSHEIAQGNEDLARRTESQAANLEQTAASMQQITATVRLSSDSASQASGVAGELSQVSRRSAEVVHSVTDTMGAIALSSNRIGEIIQVIDSIAFQTNILALNAAVESARAGEHGRGFAVVAGEVRALAQRSSSAAREIKQLISDSADKVGAGERQTESARASIDATLKSVEHFTTLIGEIDQGAREQLQGISMVYDAIQEMEGITQQNAALVEQLSRSAVEMREQTDEVSAALRVFRLERGSASGDRRPDAMTLRREARSRLTA